MFNIKIIIMKLLDVNLKFLLFVSFVVLFSTSCSKEEEIRFNVDITNLRNETVYFFIEDGTSESIPSGKVLHHDLSRNSQDSYIMVGVKLANGEILDKKNIKNGEVYKLIVNKEGSDSDVSNDIEIWELIIELTNNSSNSIYLYVDGVPTSPISSGKKLSYSQNIANQSSSFVEVKNADGIVLSAKNVSEGESYIETINDPVFTITKIILSKWCANNIFDTPDPWLNIKADGVDVGRTTYKKNVKDGAECVFSDLSITIDKVYSNVVFEFWDHDTGYSSAGSTYISGLQTTNFSKYWRKDSFTMSISDLEFTVYGTWK